MQFWNGLAVRWLFVDGLLPLLGAAVLFLLWGFARYLAAPSGKAFCYSWKEAFDPIGWLYGATILAIQSGARASSSDNGPVRFGLYICAGVALILLLAAMTNRGEDPAWKPKPSFQMTTILLIFAILTAGYAAHFPTSDNSAHSVAQTGEAK
jgi:hypothetical protein